MKFVDECARNARYSARLMRKSPLLSAAVILTLTLWSRPYARAELW